MVGLQVHLLGQIEVGISLRPQRIDALPIIVYRGVPNERLQLRHFSLVFRRVYHVLGQLSLIHIYVIDAQYLFCTLDRNAILQLTHRAGFLCVKVTGDPCSQIGHGIAGISPIQTLPCRFYHVKRVFRLFDHAFPDKSKSVGSRRALPVFDVT